MPDTFFPPYERTAHTHTHIHYSYGRDIASSRVLFSLNRPSLVKQASRTRRPILPTREWSHATRTFRGKNTEKTHRQGRPDISLATLLNTCTRPSVQLITDPWVIGARVPGSIGTGNTSTCVHGPFNESSATPCARHPVKRVFRTKVAG